MSLALWAADRASYVKRPPWLLVEIGGELYTVDLNAHCIRKVDMDLAAEIEKADAAEVDTVGE